MVKQIPNIITSLNLLCGCIALFFATSGDLVTAAFFVFFGIFFDFWDGFAARVLNAHSEVGLQLDSLADMVTSGLVPGVIMVQLLSEAFFGQQLTITETFSGTAWNSSLINYVPFFGLLITVGSAYRLAKFNVDTRQSNSFIGLPTPANTLLIVSIPLILHFQFSENIEAILLNKWVLIGVTIVSVLLLNAELRLFALKFKSWGIKTNGVRYFFLIVSLVLLIAFKFIAIPIILVLYILISLFWKGE